MEKARFWSRLAAAITGTTAETRSRIMPEGGARFLSACLGRDGAGSFEAAILEADGRVSMQTMLKMRAHEMALHPSRAICLAAGRQPGRYSTMIDLATGRSLFDLALAADHEFNGHAAFIGAGEELITTEGHVETSLGRLSFYDAATGRWLRAWPSHGIEPHEALVDEARRRMIVANGGILQRQAVGEVESSLVVLDLMDGHVIGRTVLPEELATLSMRHLAMTASGEIAVAMQDQDAQSDLRPLVGIMDLRGRLRFLEIPREIALTTRGYIGSIAVDRASRITCATSPKGNVAMFWSLAEGRWLGAIPVADGCGVAPAGAPGTFLLTGGRGDILLARTLDAADMPMKPEATVLTRNSSWQWDNHLTLLAA
ncbi:MAG TPA: DUF1513 domain-containing protein [Terriglobia bacterium]|nr:DUF1513 domain-containing protein [Terriglobia bacterium]